MNKKIAYIVIFLAILFAFVGCGEKVEINNNNEVINNLDNDVNNNDTNQNNTNDIVETTVDISEKIDISYIGIATNAPDIRDYTYVLNHIQDKFNIELEFSGIGSEDKENIDLLISANTLPDCGWVYSGVSEGKALGYYTSGAIRSIPEELVYEYAPNLSAMLETNPANRILHLAPDKNDEFYCFFANRYGFDKIGWTLVMRYDWMKNLNMEPKGNPEYLLDFLTITDEPYTIDEFTDIIYEFTFSDPDMNNENDTIGHVVCKPVIWDHAYTATVMSAYGIHPTYMDDGTGWGVPVNYSPQVKKAYTKIQEWIDMRVVPDDLYSFKWSDFDKLWASGRAGSSTIMISNIVAHGKVMSSWRNDPDVELLLMPGLVDNDGSGGRTFAYHEYEFTPFAGFFFVNKNIEDEEKLKRIIMLYDYMCLDTAGVIFCNYGEEGIHFERNVFNDIVEINQEDLPQDKKILWDAYRTPGIVKALSSANPDRININSVIFAYSLEHWPEVLTAHIIPPTALEIDVTIDWYKRENKQARVAVEKVFLKNVFSEQGDVDAAWDTLMDVLDACGYEGYLKEINTHGWLDSEYRIGNQVHPIEVYPTHGE